MEIKSYIVLLAFFAVKVFLDKLLDRLDKKKLSLLFLGTFLIGLFINSFKNLDIVSEIIMLILFAISIDDFMDMEVYWIDVIILSCIAIFCTFYYRRFDPFSLIIPILFILLAIFTTYMGIIDGIILLAISLSLKSFDFLSMMIYLSLVAGLVAIFLIMRGKRGEISFIPFIFIGYLFQNFLGNFFEVIL